MTTRTRTPIVCECGHSGFLCRAENDQPHSGLWESYTLESFKGDSLTIDDYRDKPANVLAHLKPECPECGVIGKVERMKNG